MKADQCPQIAMVEADARAHIEAEIERFQPKTGNDSYPEFL